MFYKWSGGVFAYSEVRVPVEFLPTVSKYLIAAGRLLAPLLSFSQVPVVLVEAQSHFSTYLVPFLAFHGLRHIRSQEKDNNETRVIIFSVSTIKPQKNKWNTTLMVTKKK